MKTEDKVTTNWSQTGIDPRSLGVLRSEDPEGYLRAYRAEYSRRFKKPPATFQTAEQKRAKYLGYLAAVNEKNRLKRIEKELALTDEDRQRRAEAQEARAALSAAKKRESGLKRRAKDRAENPEKYHERRVKKVKWASWDEFKPFYEEAKRLRLYTGQMWDVEHIYPIKSDWVCGLHTPDNLRISLRAENSRKANRPLGTLGDELWDQNHYSVYWPGEELTMAQKRDATKKPTK